MNEGNIVSDLLHGVILGIVQGVTEFLPVSSSGHLFIIDKVLSANFPIVFDILLHIATLAAVCIYSFPLIKDMYFVLIKFLASPKNFRFLDNYPRNRQYLQLIMALGISTLCTAPVGFLLKDMVFDANSVLVGANFLITSALLVLPFLFPKIRAKISASAASKTASTDLPNISMFYAVLLGLAQGLAVLPGISRSGTTISIAVLLGASFSQATRYSFLMAIPAILASFVFSVSDLPQLIIDVRFIPVLAGMLVAFAAGVFGLRWLSLIARKGKIWYFSIYLLIVGLFSLGLGIL